MDSAPMGDWQVQMADTMPGDPLLAGLWMFQHLAEPLQYVVIVILGLILYRLSALVSVILADQIKKRFKLNGHAKTPTPTSEMTRKDSVAMVLEHVDRRHTELQGKLETHNNAVLGEMKSLHSRISEVRKKAEDVDAESRARDAEIYKTIGGSLAETREAVVALKTLATGTVGGD